jgi:rhomboid protease GluP
MFGFSPAFRGLSSVLDVARVVTIVCIALYVLSIALEPRAVLQPRGPLGLLAPDTLALYRLGMTGTVPWDAGRWWTLITAIYLHGGILHILFNVLWIRQLGPVVQELFGPGRTAMIFTVGGVVGFLFSIFLRPLFTLPVGYTLGASGAIFGLLGAIVAYGRQRGGTFGGLVLRQYGQWAAVLFLFGLFMAGVDNWAHAGGFVGGFGAAVILSNLEQRAAGSLDHSMAILALGLTGLALFLAFLTGFVAG